MGSIYITKKAGYGGQPLGKIKASLNDKFKTVEWGEYRLGDLFYVQTYKKRFDANKVTVFKTGKYPYVVRMANNNGQKGYIDEDESFLNEGNTLSFGQDTATVFYQEQSYFTGDKIKILKCRDCRFSKKNALFFVAAITKAFSTFSWGTSSYSTDTIENQKIKLPIKNNKIDFDFMEKYIAELEAQRIAELEAYLSVTGLKDTHLSFEEEQVLREYDSINWGLFNLEVLFGKSTRGKRLKSADRIVGEMPFVTAGEADEGISAFIGNDVAVFLNNTTTIDMFGSAKYRNYKYGADDHIAVVHTEKLPKFAAIFTTSAIHKSSHTGKFDYGHNFYAKDADELWISLPIKDKQPDYVMMETIISAIHKLIIKDVVRYTDEKIKVTKNVVHKYTYGNSLSMVAEKLPSYGDDSQ